MSSAPARPGAVRAVANAIRSLSARGRGHRFHWRGLQGSLVAALAGAVATTSLVRRREMEEKLEIADARVARAETRISETTDALLAGVTDTAVRVTAAGNAAEKEAVLRTWIEGAVRDQDGTDGSKKTNFV